MRVISGAPEGLPAGLYSKLAQYRHRVFVERLGWDLRTQDGTELDQFDRSDTVYVVAQDDHGRVFGCARLLPTTRPYLLGDVFPHLLNGLPPPSSPEVWELSRFAAVDFNSRSTSAAGQFSSPIAVKLLQESIACAATHGAERLITVSPLGVERLLRRAGFDPHRAGPPMVIEGHPIFACWIETAQAANF
jgi:N-acyl-L-homoserine lactone synthetase